MRASLTLFQQSILLTNPVALASNLFTVQHRHSPKYQTAWRTVRVRWRRKGKMGGCFTASPLNISDSEFFIYWKEERRVSKKKCTNVFSLIQILNQIDPRALYTWLASDIIIKWAIKYSCSSKVTPLSTWQLKLKFAFTMLIILAILNAPRQILNIRYSCCYFC